MPEAARKEYDWGRSSVVDAAVAGRYRRQMASYEEAVADKKRELFARMLKGLPQEGAVVVEVGIGPYPNAAYMVPEGGPTQMDIVGVDPNDSMYGFAKVYARQCGLIGRNLPNKNKLRVVHGLAEALPLGDNVADAVVCTLILSSVFDVDLALSEIKRVLKPGGQFVFHEHVLSETDKQYAKRQIEASDEHAYIADGDRFDRRLLENIKAAGFSKVDSEYFELYQMGLSEPTIEGIAIL